jgi:hypothetical protein
LDAIAPVKFFTPNNNWTWYASEFDRKDLLLGLVPGFKMGLGYLSLKALKETKCSGFTD